jgi:hypothetical protein
MARIQLLISTTAALAILATTGVASAANSITAPASCGYDGYSYAGLTATQPESGVSADITALQAPKITTGHVAAWVGVGGVGLGPGGSNEWIQAGISAVPGAPTSLYVEVARPKSEPLYHVLPLTLAIGHTYDVAVQESPTHPGSWSVWVDGVQKTTNVYLPGSHDAWKPIATTESWDGGSPACNAFTFRFANLRAKETTGPSWAPMQSAVIDAPGYRVTQRTLAGFTAVGGKV